MIRLLLVDDEEDFRIPIAAIMRKHGTEVVEAGSPTDVDRLLAHGKPDVIVQDVNMPGENGFEIPRRLKQGGNYTSIMLTANGDVGDRIEGVSRGVDYYLTKPVDTVSC